MGYTVGCPMILRKETLLYLKGWSSNLQCEKRIESPQVTWEFSSSSQGPFLEGSRKEGQLCEERSITSPTRFSLNLSHTCSHHSFTLYSPGLHMLAVWVPSRRAVCCARCRNPRAGRQKVSKTMQLAKRGSLLLSRGRALCHIQRSGAGQRAPSPSCYTYLQGEHTRLV